MQVVPLLTKVIRTCKTVLFFLSQSQLFTRKQTYSLSDILLMQRRQKPKCSLSEHQESPDRNVTSGTLNAMHKVVKQGENTDFLSLLTDFSVLCPNTDHQPTHKRSNCIQGYWISKAFVKWYQNVRFVSKISEQTWATWKCYSFANQLLQVQTLLSAD